MFALLVLLMAAAKKKPIKTGASIGHKTNLKQSILETFNIYGCHTADSKPVKQEVKGTVILPPLVFLG